MILDSDTTGEAIRKCILQGYPLSVARLDHDGSYVVIRDGHRGKPHPTSILSRVPIPPPFIVFSEAEWVTDSTVGASLLAGSYTSAGHKGGYLLKHCSEISFEWILQLVSGVYETRGGFESAINDAVADIPAAKPPPKMVYRAKGERKILEVNDEKKQDNLYKARESGPVNISDMIADSLQRLF